MKNWKVGKKVFRTEEEARQFSKDLQRMGAIGGWCPTDEEPTHIYTGDADHICRTEAII